MEDIKKQAAQLPENQRFVVLLHDEMIIKRDLVYDRRSGEVVGYADLKIFSLENTDDLATHVLFFYVVDVNSHLKVSLGFSLQSRHLLMNFTPCYGRP